MRIATSPYLLVALGVSFLFLVAPSEAKPEFFKTSYALVIGIDEYPSSSTWPKLSYAVNDAKGMAQFLTGQGYKVIGLYNEEATRNNIISQMEDELAPKLTEDDRVLIFFAGHGATRPIGGKDYGYIVPYDGGAGASSYIAMAELRDKSSKMGTARHQLFILDACYGGSLFRGVKTLEVDEKNFPENSSYIQELARRPARLILSAGGKNQVVRDDGPGGHSHFTYHLLEALKKAFGDINNDGYISFSELVAYLEPRAAAWNQTPAGGNLPGHGLGSFIFKSSRAPLSPLKSRPASEKIRVHMYSHETGFTLTDAEQLKDSLEEDGITATIETHVDPTSPDAIFLGVLVSARAARVAISSVPYEIRYIFRPDYPDIEGGDRSGRLIGIGYMSTHNKDAREARSKPIKVTTTELESLIKPGLSNVEFQHRLREITGF